MSCAGFSDEVDEAAFRAVVDQRQGKRAALASAVEVRFDGSEHGDAAFAAVPRLPGELVLLERPVVWMPSLMSLVDRGLHQQCWSCGALLISVNDDILRCRHLTGDVSLPLRTPSSARTTSPAAPRWWLGSSRYNHVVFFCNATCETRGVAHHGMQRLLHKEEPAAAPGVAEKADRLSQSSNSDDCSSQHYTAADILVPDALPVPQGMHEVVGVLWHLSCTFNERIFLMVKWLASLTCAFFRSQDHDGPKHETLDSFVSSVLVGYADGACRTLSREQRALLRFVHKCLNSWLECVGANSCCRSELKLSLQTLVHMMWVLDANLHTYIVTCPLYNVAQHLSHASARLAAHSAASSPIASAPPEPDACSDRSEQLDCLAAFFARHDPVVLHATGVALYATATKFNHSCQPNVRFLPNAHCVVAHVVALAPIQTGYELRTSYLDVNAYASADERRSFLLQNYGFVCDCPLCAADANSDSQGSVVVGG